MAPKRKENPILAAARHLSDEDNALLDEVDAEDESDEDIEAREYDTDDLSVDDMAEVMDRLPTAAKAKVNATRQRGQSPHRAAPPVHQTRAKQQTKEPTGRDRVGTWMPADTLYAPPPKAGYEQRWIRIRLGEKDDPRNFGKKFREGWKPVKLEDVQDDIEPPTEQFGRFGSVVAVSDLVLCERPVEIGVARKKYFRKRLERQLMSADRRHVNKVQRDDHVIHGGARTDMKPSVGRGSRNRQAPVQDDGE